MRGLQFADKLPVTGMVDTNTADAIGESVRLGLTPDWFVRETKMGDSGDDIAHMRALLGLSAGESFDAHMEASMRRFQSAHHLPLTGRMRKGDAITLGDDAPWQAQQSA